MTIAKRLILLLAVPLLALLGLAAFIRLELSRMEVQSRFTVDTQMVGLALVGDIAQSYSEMRINVRRHFMEPEPAQRAAAATAFAAGEKTLTSRLAEYGDGLITSDRDRRLYNQYSQLSTEWTKGAHEVMSLAEAGQAAAALDKLNGPMAVLGEQLGDVSREWIKLHEETSMAAGKEGVESVENFRWRMLIANSLAILITAVLGYLTFRRIATPIRALDVTVRGIAAGDYAREVPFTRATDETGGLARSIEVLKQGAAAVEEQRWVKASAARLAGELQSSATLDEFGRRLLGGLVPLLGGGVAGFYLFKDSPPTLERVADLGLAEGAAAKGVIQLGEGLVGQCAREQKPLKLSQLPPDYLRITSGLGGAKPSQALALPLLSQSGLLGVLEHAGFREFSRREQALLDGNGPRIRADFIGDK